MSRNLDKVPKGGNEESHALKATRSVNQILHECETPKKALRVMLIQAPSRGGVRSLLSHVEEDGSGIGYKPPLGLLSVGTTIAKQSPHEVKMVDAQAQGLSFEEVVTESLSFSPDIVGISAWTDWWYPAYYTGKLIKEALPNVHLTYGGPHLGIYHKETLEIPFIDSVIVGDGERPFLFLCNMIANGRMNSEFPGLHTKSSGVKLGDPLFYIQENLDDLPTPNRTMLPINMYSSVLGKGRYTTTMITSRGCPYKCTFCKLNFQKTLCRSARSVVEEFKQISDLGIKEVEIYDDTFTWSKKRVLDICEGIIKLNIDIEWAVRDRVSNVRVDLLEAMYQAGCKRIHYGIESGVNSVLHRMRKNINIRQARHAVQLAKDTGMTVLTYFMFGNLGESLDDMKRTIDFALELDADYCEFSITIPYAGTEMYSSALREGVISNDYWLEYACRPTPNFLPPELIEEHVDKNRLIGLRNEAVRRFYFRPKYAMRQLGDVSSLFELVRKASMGGRLLHSVYSR